MRLDITKNCALTVARLLSFIGAAILLTAPATARDYRPALPASAQYSYNPANEVDVELVLAVDISQSMVPTGNWSTNMPSHLFSGTRRCSTNVICRG